MLPFFVTIPHSGEKVPDLCPWLQGLPEEVLMCDVDRFVDRLYEPALQRLQIPFVKTEWHRFAADLNRLPSDVDVDSVQGASQASGAYPRGFHPLHTTQKHPLIKTPMSQETHRKLVQLIHDPFHESVRKLYANAKSKGAAETYHLDLHSMPSMGTSEHRDPGERRADIVVSDSKGKSSRVDFVDLVITSYVRAGFKVGYNWPYYGGRLTEQYGQPGKKENVVQVELNRSLYMDEVSKKWVPEKGEAAQKKLEAALTLIQSGLKLLS